MVYEFIRKMIPELLGFKNKKKYREKIAAKKQAILDSCDHTKAYIYDWGGGDLYALHCPTCRKDFDRVIKD